MAAVAQGGKSRSQWGKAGAIEYCSDELRNELKNHRTRGKAPKPRQARRDRQARREQEEENKKKRDEEKD